VSISVQGPRHLILVRHSIPQVNPGVSSREWVLSEAGKALCAPLAEGLRPYGPAAIVTSPEWKAQETARLVASEFGVPVQVIQDLREHDRSGLGYLERDAFEQQIAVFFQHPTELVFGMETAQQTYERFAGAVEKALASHPESIIAVTHGTVMSLFLSRKGQTDPLALWKDMGMPSYAALEVPGYHIHNLVTSISHGAP